MEVMAKAYCASIKREIPLSQMQVCELISILFSLVVCIVFY